MAVFTYFSKHRHLDIMALMDVMFSIFLELYSLLIYIL